MINYILVKILIYNKKIKELDGQFHISLTKFWKNNNDSKIKDKNINKLKLNIYKIYE